MSPLFCPTLAKNGFELVQDWNDLVWFWKRVNFLAKLWIFLRYMMRASPDTHRDRDGWYGSGPWTRSAAAAANLQALHSIVSKSSQSFQLASNYHRWVTLYFLLVHQGRWIEAAGRSIIFQLIGHAPFNINSFSMMMLNIAAKKFCLSIT